jgi:hypothetical protein
VLVRQRVANRAHPFADAQGVGIAERSGGERSVGLDLDQRDVGIGIRTDHLGAQRASVGQLDQDAFGSLDDMVIGKDVALGLDDDAAARATTRHIELVAAVRRLPWMAVAFRLRT